jgi:hypothetical protein
LINDVCRTHAANVFGRMRLSTRLPTPGARSVLLRPMVSG